MKRTLLRKLKRYAKVAGDKVFLLYKSLIAPFVVGYALLHGTPAVPEPPSVELGPVEEPDAPSTIQQLGTRHVVTGDGLRVRNEPNFKGVILGQLPINSRVTSTREDGD